MKDFLNVFSTIVLIFSTAFFPIIWVISENSDKFELNHTALVIWCITYILSISHVIDNSLGINKNK